jgi:ABC-type branched-subunit amino acid transport system substrate-binding protein
MRVSAVSADAGACRSMSRATSRSRTSASRVIRTFFDPQESMRHVPFTILLGSLFAGSAGCALIQGLDEFTTADRAAAPAGTVADGAAGPAPQVEGSAPDAGCHSTRECVALATNGETPSTSATSKASPPTVCVAATGKCESLVSEDCPRVYGDSTNDNAIVVGTLLSDSSASALEQASFLAVEEIDGNGGGVPSSAAGGAVRPLVVVGCNAGSDVLRATRHLAEVLHAPAIVGPISGEQVVEATQQISAKAGTLLMTPTSPAMAISKLSDGDLTWRATPSDAQRAKLVIEEIKDLETVLRATRGLTTVKLGIVSATDALGTSAREAISGKLILNGRFLNDAANAANVSLDAYPAGSASAQSAVATKYAATFRPDIVFVTAAEQIANVVVPLEQALTTARAPARPYYVLTDAARTSELLDAVATTLPADIRRRIRGVGVKPDASSAPVLDDFRAAFAARYGAAPAESAAAVSYDAMYAIAYALAATPGQAPTGASVAHGLRTLAVGNPAVVGAKGLGPVMRDLSSGKSVSLRGTFGLMQWDTSGDITGGTVEVWCVGGGAGAPAFGGSGLTMDVQTQVVGGAFVQCQ